MCIHLHVQGGRGHADVTRRLRIGCGEGVGAGRQVRRGEAPGAGAARGRGAEGLSAGIRHRHRGATGGVPVKVTDLLEFSTAVLMTGAAGGGVLFAVGEILLRSHWLGLLAAEKSSVVVLPVAVTV